jgi:hypothetical protein
VVSRATTCDLGTKDPSQLTHGFSPFFVVYGSKAILPTDIAFGAPCVQFYEEGEAEQTCRVDLDVDIS